MSRSTFIRLSILKHSGTTTHLTRGGCQSMTTGIIMAVACRGTTGRADSAGLTGGVMIPGGVTIRGWVTGGIHGTPPAQASAPAIIWADRITITPWHGTTGIIQTGMSTILTMDTTIITTPTGRKTATIIHITITMQAIILHNLTIPVTDPVIPFPREEVRGLSQLSLATIPDHHGPAMNMEGAAVAPMQGLIAEVSR
jgi:hypothetical protein